MVSSTPHGSGRRRKWQQWLGIAAVLAVLAAVGITKWKAASDHGGQQPAEPFRIAGNLYYVGANDATSFLLTGPKGHVLIDGGYPGTAPMIMASIAKLGFSIRDVKVLLNSEPHFDHAGGLAELQKASGAELWASEASADAIASGGLDDAGATFWPMKLLIWSRLARYPVARVDHRFQDGATIRLGPIKLTAHITPGHTRGCTTWAFPVRAGNRELQVVSAGSLTLLPGMSLVEPERYPGIRADFERSFRVLRSLPADIFLTAHARQFDRYRKFRESLTAADPVAPFIDRAGYLSYIAKGEEKFRKELRAQQEAQ
jgi:metallo-beta-lactamase class B